MKWGDAHSLTDIYCMHQFFVLTRDTEFITIGRWLAHNRIQCEYHLNRTRFWIPEGPLLTEFLLRWGDRCPPVETEHLY